MTTEEKAKAYDEALERAKELLLGNEHSNTIRSYFEHIFPELRESEEEKPSGGLDEEIERYLHSLGVGYGGWVDGMEDDDLRGIARHFAEWQKAQDDRLVDIIYQQGIEKGKDDMKEQMMKESVEGEVMTNGFYPYEPRIVISYPGCPYEFGEKVRLVIIKED